MNGFKLGQWAKGENSSQFLGEKYIKPILQHGPFQPQTTSTVFYPSKYQEIYSPEGEFADSLKEMFSISGGFDPLSQITTLEFVRKV